MVGIAICDDRRPFDIGSDDTDGSELGRYLSQCPDPGAVDTVVVRYEDAHDGRSCKPTARFLNDEAAEGTKTA